jgi:hypothetical protein
VVFPTAAIGIRTLLEGSGGAQDLLWLWLCRPTEAGLRFDWGARAGYAAVYGRRTLRSTALRIAHQSTRPAEMEVPLMAAVGKDAGLAGRVAPRRADLSSASGRSEGNGLKRKGSRGGGLARHLLAVHGIDVDTPAVPVIHDPVGASDELRMASLEH